MNRTLRLMTIALSLLGGCIGSSDRATTQPTTAIDPETVQPHYWLSQPGVAEVTAQDFQTLWSACEDVARDYFFKLDRNDWRSGVLTTQPMVSSQFFEPWRRELQTAADVAESSTATIRRTIRFEVSANGHGTYTVTPKVLVERQSLAERRVTSVVLYRGVFGGRSGTGTAESDQQDSLVWLRHGVIQTAG